LIASSFFLVSVIAFSIAIKELEITYCIRVASLPKVALFFEMGIKSVKSSESESVAELPSFATTTKQKKPGFLEKPGF
jgi:hypothetical protein